MESLLRWGIENSGTDDVQPRPRADLDPAIIDQILGKPDAELMKEALAVAVDETKNEDDRVEALDNFEMLVENIDNANNVQKLQMWKPLQDLLTSATSTDPIRTQTLWVIGTILQNNPAAQSAYLALGPIPTLLSFLPPSSHSSQTRSKAVYAISGLLKHNASAVAQLDETNGWSVFCAALEDSDITVRRKVAFLLNTLLIPTSTFDASEISTSETNLLTPTSMPPRAPVHANSHASMLSDPSSVSTTAATFKAIQNRGILSASVSSIVSPIPHGADGETEGDIDFEEKVIRLLYTYAVSCSGQFPPDVKRELCVFFDKQAASLGGRANFAERWGLEEGEMKVLREAVQ